MLVLHLLNFKYYVATLERSQKCQPSLYKANMQRKSNGLYKKKVQQRCWMILKLEEKMRWSFSHYPNFFNCSTQTCMIFPTWLSNAWSYACIELVQDEYYIKNMNLYTLIPCLGTNLLKLHWNCSLDLQPIEYHCSPLWKILVCFPQKP